MRVRILLFAALRDRAGRSELDLEFEDGATLGEVRAELERRFPGLLTRSRAAAAVNAEVARDEDVRLCEGDEIAYLPPVSGG